MSKYNYNIVSSLSIRYKKGFYNLIIRKIRDTLFDVKYEISSIE